MSLAHGGSFFLQSTPHFHAWRAVPANRLDGAGYEFLGCFPTAEAARTAAGPDGRVEAFPVSDTTKGATV